MELEKLVIEKTTKSQAVNNTSFLFSKFLEDDLQMKINTAEIENIEQ